MNSRKAVLFIGDIVLLYLSLWLTLILRYGTASTSSQLLSHIVPFTLLFVVWISVFFINNLYSVGTSTVDYRFYSYLVQNLIICTLIGFAFFYLAPLSVTTLRPQRVLIVLICIYAILFVSWRFIFYRILSSQTLTKMVMFVGITPDTQELIEYLHAHPHLGYVVSTIVTLDSHFPNEKSIPTLKDGVGIIDAITSKKIQTVVVSTGHENTNDITRYLFDALSLGIEYVSFPNFYERVTGRVPVSSLREDWFLENLMRNDKKLFALIKRIQDVIFASCFGLLSLFFVPFIAAGIAISSPGPILFSQIRTGKGGRPFRVMKFRTMIQNAERSGPQWATKNDTRVTRIGRFMRKTRLDEIPQFVNILVGDMSFVGPRPERPEFVGSLSQSIPYYRERLLIKPGLTGWAQINYKYGDTVEDALKKLQYDIFYIKNRSFALDASIIMKTVNTIFNATLGQ